MIRDVFLRQWNKSFYCSQDHTNISIVLLLQVVLLPVLLFLHFNSDETGTQNIHMTFLRVFFPPRDCYLLYSLTGELVKEMHNC